MEFRLLKVSRKEAMKRGDKQYFTGRTCIRGHIAPRQVVNGRCAACHAERSWAESRYDIRKVMVKSARQRAAKTGLDFRITADDVPLDDCCPICRVAFHKKPQARMPSSEQNSPSLDRVIPALGYVPGNVAVICRDCNSKKGGASLEELERIVKFIKAHGYANHQ